MTVRRAAALLAGALLLLLAACNGAPPGGDPTPSAVTPTGLKAEAGDRYVDLTWEEADGDDLESYGIYQGTSATELERVAEVPADKTTHRVSGLDNGTEYFFAIDAKTASGARSTRTAAVSATPQPAGEVPIVTGTTPSNGASNIGRNSNINVSFSKGMNLAPTVGAFNASPAIACEFSWNALGDRLTCDPASDLEPNEEYTITIAASAASADGHPMDEAYTFRFTTAAGTSPTCVFGSTNFGECLLGE